MQVNKVGAGLLWNSPLNLIITDTSMIRGHIECFTYNAINFKYIGFNAGGMNVCLLSILENKIDISWYYSFVSFVPGLLLLVLTFALDMTPFILIIVIIELIVPHHYHPPAVLFAGMCFLAIVPLAYIIGSAVGR